MKPTEEELAHALAEARRVVKAGEDRHELARSLLYVHQRVQTLTRVQQAAARYVRFGLPEKEHADLVLALEGARREEAPEADEEERLGLG
jgi:hypothetical protein